MTAADMRGLSDTDLDARRCEAAEAAHNALMRYHALDDELRARRRAAELEELAAVADGVPNPPFISAAAEEA